MFSHTVCEKERKRDHMAASEHHQDTELAELWITSVEKSGFCDETRNLQLGSSHNTNLPCLTFLCSDLGKEYKRVPLSSPLSAGECPWSLAGVSVMTQPRFWAHTEGTSTGSGFQRQWIRAAPVSSTWMLSKGKQKL